MKHIVQVREVHISHREVDAESASEAIDLVRRGDGDETFCEYSHTMDSETWSVEDEKGNVVLD